MLATKSVIVMPGPVRGAYINAISVYLRDRTDRAVPAIELAEHLKLLGNHETRRRAVRKLIKQMHEEGIMICADSHPTEGGYWYARDDGEWSRYLDARASQARFKFVAIRTMREAAADRNSGQGRLF